MAMVWEGPEAVLPLGKQWELQDPLKAAPGTIRHDFALGICQKSDTCI